MKRRMLAGPLLALGSWTSAQAATVLASYGAYDHKQVRGNVFTIEASSERKALHDFSFASVNHGKSRTIHDSLELIASGLGVDFSPLRLNLDIGYFLSLDKFALDELDYGISRSILGAGISLDLSVLELHAHARNYIPYASARTTIDSFSLSFNPYSYQQSEAGIRLSLGFVELEGNVGRFDRLRGRYDILDESFMLTLPAVTYGRASLVLKGQKSTLVRIEAHKVLDDHGRRSDFQKLIGTAMHRDAYDGGSLGIGFSF